MDVISKVVSVDEAGAALAAWSDNPGPITKIMVEFENKGTMIKSCVTIALVPQIKTGPWIFWENLEESIAKAADLGFDGVELFTLPPRPSIQVNLQILTGKIPSLT